MWMTTINRAAEQRGEQSDCRKQGAAADAADTRQNRNQRRGRDGMTKHSCPETLNIYMCWWFPFWVPEGEQLKAKLVRRH